MDRTKVKICGLMRLEDIAYANEVKPDYAGFILAPGFRRSITWQQAEMFRLKLDERIPAVGVFVDAPGGEVIDFLENGTIQIAQLHGNETEDTIRMIRNATGKPVIKAVKISRRCDAEAWLGSSADFLLFDSGTGTGKTFDWNLLSGIDRAYFLAGGLHAGNLAAAIAKLHPYAVDISSGVETEGVKDKAKMREVMGHCEEFNEKRYITMH